MPASKFECKTFFSGSTAILKFFYSFKSLVFDVVCYRISIVFIDLKLFAHLCILPTLTFHTLDIILYKD